jgi:hypothetical protein
MYLRVLNACLPKKIATNVKLFVIKVSNCNKVVFSHAYKILINYTYCPKTTYDKNSSGNLSMSNVSDIIKVHQI